MVKINEEFGVCMIYKDIEEGDYNRSWTGGVIADGIHLPATILKLVYKLKGVENTCLVTDALAYAAYEGNEPIDPRYIIEDGVCKMADHSALAGSLATMDVLVRTMVKKANIPLEDAVRMASETPARLIGVSDRKGALAKGKDADIVIDHETLNFGKEINDAGYYIVYSWESENSLLKELDIRGH